MVAVGKVEPSVDDVELSTGVGVTTAVATGVGCLFVNAFNPTLPILGSLL